MILGNILALLFTLGLIVFLIWSWIEVFRGWNNVKDLKNSIKFEKKRKSQSDAYSLSDHQNELDRRAKQNWKEMEPWLKRRSNLLDQVYKHVDEIIKGKK